MADLLLSRSETGPKRQRLLQAAEDRLREALYGQLDALGKRHPDTLCSVGNLADVLREQGLTADALAMLGDADAVASECLGPFHMTTLVLSAKAARLNFESARADRAWEEARAAATALAHVVAAMRERLGGNHPQTRKYAEICDAMEATKQVTEA